MLKNDKGEQLGTPLDLQVDVTKENLESLMQKLDNNNNEVCSFVFFLNRLLK